VIWRHNGSAWRDAGLHNSIVGMPVFLVCNGPSFAQVDASKLCGPGRVVIGVNSSYPRLRPDIWIGMDDSGCFEQSLFSEPFPKIMREGFKDSTINGRPLRGMSRVMFADVSKCCTSFFDWGEGDKFQWTSNTMHTALQIALWMGSRDIYLVGCDLSLDDGDYADGNYLTGEQRKRNARCYAHSVEFLRKVHAAGAEKGYEITSCSPTSKLNAFMPHLDIKDVIAAIEDDVPRGRPKLHVCDRKKNVVLVLRSGGDFTTKHVDRMIEMLTGCTITLLTDAEYQREGVKVIPLASLWPGWWSKMEMFRPDVLPDEGFLYIDLDTNINALPAEYWHGESTALAPFAPDPNHCPMQSGFMFLTAKDRKAIWEKWILGPGVWMLQFRGDQDFLSQHGPKWRFWQDRFPNQVLSYKLNLLAGADTSQCQVLCFHGKPRPWEISLPAPGEESRFLRLAAAVADEARDVLDLGGGEFH
jgi:hypothetical protein